MADMHKKKRRSTVPQKVNIPTEVKNAPRPVNWETPRQGDAELMLARDFYECKPGESVRLITGEGTIWNDDRVRRALQHALDIGVKVKCIVGPVIKVVNDSNFLLELALQKKITMYVTSRREWTHYRVFGERCVWVEKYHEPLAPSKERKGKYIENNNNYSLFSIYKFIKEFELTISALDLTPIKNSSELLKLEQRQIRKLKVSIRKRDEFFDDYKKEELEQLLAS